MLKDLKCRHIEKTEQPVSSNQAKVYLKEIPEWSIINSTIHRDFLLKNFMESMEFVNKIAGLANSEDHHPDIFISYNKVNIDLSTHKIGGLSMNDFILAAKIDNLL